MTVAAAKTDSELRAEDDADLAALDPGCVRRVQWRDLADPNVRAWFAKRVKRHMCPGRMEPRATLDVDSVIAELAFLLQDERVDKIEVMNASFNDNWLCDNVPNLVRNGFADLDRARLTSSIGCLGRTSLCITTKPIQMVGTETGVQYDEDLGQIQFYLSIRHARPAASASNAFAGRQHLLAHPLTPNVVHGLPYGEDVFHPHIQASGNCCLGEYDGRIQAMIKYGNLPAAIDLILGVMFTYNPLSPYRHMKDWRTRLCPYCRELLQPDAPAPEACRVCRRPTCSRCRVMAGPTGGAPLGCTCTTTTPADAVVSVTHRDCSSTCASCGVRVCQVCMPPVPGEASLFCMNCRTTCPDCNRVVRRGAFNTRLGVCHSCTTYASGCRCGLRVQRSRQVEVMGAGSGVYRCEFCTEPCRYPECNFYFNPAATNVRGVCPACVKVCRACSNQYASCDNVKILGHGTTVRRRPYECQSCFEGRLSEAGCDVEACKAGLSPKDPAADAPPAPAAQQVNPTPEVPNPATIQQVFGVSSVEDFMVDAFPG